MHGKLKIVLKGARNVIDQDGWGKGDSDCYVIITLPDKQTKKSSIIKDNLNPNWNEEFIFDVKIDKKVRLFFTPESWRVFFTYMG